MNTIRLHAYRDLLFHLFGHVLGLFEGLVKHLQPYLGVHVVVEGSSPIFVIEIDIAEDVCLGHFELQVE